MLKKCCVCKVARGFLVKKDPINESCSAFPFYSSSHITYFMREKKESFYVMAVLTNYLSYVNRMLSLLLQNQISPQHIINFTTNALKMYKKANNIILMKDNTYNT